MACFLPVECVSPRPLSRFKTTPSPTSSLAIWNGLHSVYGECISLNKPTFTLLWWLSNSFLHEAKDSHLAGHISGTYPRPGTWPSSNAPFSCNMTKREKRSWSKELDSEFVKQQPSLPSPIHTGEKDLTLAPHSPFYRTEGAIYPVSIKLENSDYLFANIC